MLSFRIEALTQLSSLYSSAFFLLLTEITILPFSHHKHQKTAEASNFQGFKFSFDHRLDYKNALDICLVGRDYPLPTHSFCKNKQQTFSNQLTAHQQFGGIIHQLHTKLVIQNTNFPRLCIKEVQLMRDKAIDISLPSKYS